MAILAFQKPDKVIMLDGTDTFGRFEFRPLEPGYAITIGNALRRILLGSLEGYAFTSVKIDGVDHEFSTIEGVMEEMIEIILNLKQVRLARLDSNTEAEKVTVNVKDLTELTAGHLSQFMTGFKVLNPELVICRMEKSVKFQMELTIEKGRGYVPAEENTPAEAPIGLLPIDSIHTPIKNVKFTREDFRVEQKTDYEKLLLEITTDGSITPKDALKEAAKILIFHFQLFSDEKITLETEEKTTHEEFDEDILHMRQLLKTRLTEHDLSVRALNCLKTAEVETLGDLVRFHRSELLKFRNFGKKSLTELDELLAAKGLSFSMDVAKYKLDKE
ncbi:MAG: DNA-directed RNA polymerase subunit alpha [Rikenellaceae bacterium]